MWLRRIDGHAAWGNSVALAQADRDLSGDWQPEGGVIHRDEKGQPTGVFIDGAMALVDSAVPAISREVLSSALDQASLTLNALGLTGVHDPGIDRATVELYLEKIREGKFPLRVYAMADGMTDTLAWLCENGPINDPSGRTPSRIARTMSVRLHEPMPVSTSGVMFAA